MEPGRLFIYPGRSARRVHFAAVMKAIGGDPPRPCRNLLSPVGRAPHSAVVAPESVAWGKAARGKTYGCGRGLEALAASIPKTRFHRLASSEASTYSHRAPSQPASCSETRFVAAD